MPVASVTTMVKASTAPFTVTSARPAPPHKPRADMSETAFRIPTAQGATSRPSVPPRTARKRLSVRNCRINRARLAPSAMRTAISLCRVAVRAVVRLATLAQAIRRTKPTAPNKIRSGRRVSPTTCSRRPTRPTPQPLSSGACCTMRCAIVSISACACDRLTPGFIRAMAMY